MSQLSGHIGDARPESFESVSMVELEEKKMVVVVTFVVHMYREVLQ